MTRSILPFALILLVSMLVGFMTFTNTHTACSEHYNKVMRECKNLYTMCDELEQIAGPLSAFAYRHLPGIQSQLATVTLARTTLDARGSMMEMAKATALLSSTLSNFVIALDGTSAVDSSEYSDLRDRLNDTMYQIAIASKAYNNEVVAYNAVLEQPIVSLWNEVIRFKPADLFTTERKRRDRAPRTQAPDTPSVSGPAVEAVETPVPTTNAAPFPLPSSG